MERGDTVMIYHDPVTRQESEGKAILHEELRPDCGDGLSLWDVIFYDDIEEVYTRTVNSNPL